MKRFVSIIFSVLFVCVTVCCAMRPLDIDEDLVNVVYNGKSLTIYLEGGVPKADAERALSSGMAQMSHDFFEVVFEYKDGADTYTARASWELGQSVGISGVYRNAAGVDYGSVDPDPTYIGSLPAGVTAGSAVLFVGTKADKTLLGVGRLAAVDGKSDTIITTETSTITFEVAALETAGIYSLSCTSAPVELSGTETIVSTTYSVDKDFDVFGLPADLSAQYDIGVVSSADYDDYKNAIKVRRKGSAEIITPGFRSNGLRWFADDGYLDNSVSVEMINNQTVDNIFENTIEFLFDNNTDDKVFSFTFDIPVYAISKTPVQGIPDSIDWYVRPGIKPFCYDLDDGGYGGAVLIGTGAIPAVIPVSLKVAP